MHFKANQTAAAYVANELDEHSQEAFEIHMMGCSECVNDVEAWRVIKDTGGRVSQCPPLEMAMGHGFPAIQEALDHAVRPSLSSDHSATVAQDMFGVMRSTFTFQRLNILQRRMRNEQNVPPLLTCRDVLEFATVEGARCANLDSKIGTLSPGKDADIVLLTPERHRFDPSHSLSAVQWSSFEGREFTVRVAGTWCRGQQVYDGQRIVNRSGDGRFLRPRSA